MFQFLHTDPITCLMMDSDLDPASRDNWADRVRLWQDIFSNSWSCSGNTCLPCTSFVYKSIENKYYNDLSWCFLLNY